MPQPDERQAERRAAQFHRWDGLIGSEEFALFLESRGLVMHEARPGPPHDVQAEKDVLGALLWAGAGEQWELLSAGWRRLHPRHFSLQTLHAPILRAIAIADGWREAGKCPGVDLFTIREALKRVKLPDGSPAAVPMAYVAAVQDQSPGVAYLAWHTDAVLAAARLRSLYELGDRLHDATTAPEAQPGAVLNAARNAIDAIEEHGAPDLAAIFGRTK